MEERKIEKTTPEQADAKIKEITPEQIGEWKKQHGKVFRIESGGKVAYLRRPTRKIIAMANVIGGVDLLKVREVLVQNCWLGGDMDFQTDDRYFLGLSTQVDAIIEMAEVSLKEV